MAFTFKGGIHPNYNKERTYASPIEVLPPTEEMYLPLSQHIGAPCIPTVKPGDTVKMGQIIADNTVALSCPIHSPVSGKFKGIVQHWHPSGTRQPTMLIENDGLDTVDETLEPYEGDLDDLTPSDIIRYARESGTVGMGGAGFPLHVKLKTALDKKIERSS